MATAKKTPTSESTTLTLSRTEATQLFAVLNKAQELVSVIGRAQGQSFLGGLIKKVNRAAGGPIKRVTPSRSIERL